jgi:two-component system phosphate regulon sensor histidine kinase PhoR
MNSKGHKSVIIVVAISLITLISVQVYWARRNYNEAETVFNGKIHKVLQSVKDETNDAATCFIMYSKTYLDSNEGIFLMKSSWHGKEEEWNKNVKPDSISMFFNIPEEYKNSPLNKVYKDLKFSNPVTAEILLKFRYDINKNSPDKYILRQNTTVNNFREIIKNHEPLLNIYDTLMIDSLIKLRLSENDLHPVYSYALVKSTTDSVAYTSNRKQTAEILKAGIRTRFTPDDLFSYPYDIILYVSNKPLIILSNILTVLLLSVGVILILLFAYIYFIRTINRQKKLSEMKNDFINNLTHEFNTPISNISLACETLWENGKIIKDPFSERSVDIIRDEAERLKDNVSRILRISSFEGSKFNLSKEQLQVNELIRCSLARLSLKINHKKAIIHFTPSEEPILITGDRSHLSGAIDNLIENALKYCNGNCMISISVTRENGVPAISISDNGIGMQHDELDKIFDKFYRVQHGNIQNERGFGLGLNYVKQVIEAHGGKISVSSKQGEGSSFRILLN